MTESHETPTVIERAAQPYVGVRELITMTTFNLVADQLPGLFGWLGRTRSDPERTAVLPLPDHRHGAVP